MTSIRRSSLVLPRNHVNLAIALVAVVCAGTIVPQTPLATSLLVIAVVAEAFSIQFRGVRVSGCFPRSCWRWRCSVPSRRLPSRS